MGTGEVLEVSRNDRGLKIGELQTSFLAMLAPFGEGAGEAGVPSEAQLAKRPNNTVPVIFTPVDDVGVVSVHQFVREDSGAPS